MLFPSPTLETPLTIEVNINGRITIFKSFIQMVPMEMMKRLLKAKRLHQAVMFHDVRWGGEHNGRYLWVLLNSGSCGAYAFNHDPDTLNGVHSYRQPAGYFPIPGGTFAGESLPGAITWARAYSRATHTTGRTIHAGQRRRSAARTTHAATSQYAAMYTDSAA